MTRQVIIEELPHDPEFERLFAQSYRNLIWFSEHAEVLGVFTKHRGRYVAAAGKDLFVSDSREEVDRLPNIQTKCRTFGTSLVKRHIAFQA
jgi:hypothetical protein